MSAVLLTGCGADEADREPPPISATEEAAPEQPQRPEQQASEPQGSAQQGSEQQGSERQGSDEPEPPTEETERMEDPERAESPDVRADTEDGQLTPADPARISAVSDGFREVMEDTTWRPGCPVEIDDLRMLRLRHVDLDGAEREGELIVHADVARDVLAVFARLYEDRFPIARIEPVAHFDGDDEASMAANNSSAFNCRSVTGGDRWSEHSYGWAVDINPIQNPYQRDGEVLPREGEPYLDRDDVRPGMLTRPGVVDLFDQIGWGWGGDWDGLVDYMHLSRTGR